MAKSVSDEVAVRRNGVGETATLSFPRADIEGSVPERFRSVVRACSENPAIVTEDGVLSFDELDRKSNRIAHAILERDPHGNSPVPLLFGHDQRAIVSLLGVLKAGRCYVPIDVSNPAERNRLVLEDINPTILLHSESTRTRAEEIVDTRTLLMEVDEVVSDARYGDEVPPVEISPDMTAYIVYTSGTTGRPKGVMQNHRNVLHRAWSYGTTAELTSDDRLVLFYSPSASGAVRDIFGSVLNGAALYPYDLRTRGFQGLVSWLRAEGITVYNSVATVFRHFAATLTSRVDLPDLRLVQLGSETIYTTDARLYKSLLPDTCNFVARLGSSEISPICKFYIDKSTELDSFTVPAGYAVEDVEVLIVDEDGQALGPGQEGEIVVRSRYLTPGYWNQPDLTAAMLKPVPEVEGCYSYRSGDLGRMAPDGCLTHLGRKDFQVKIDGHRVEVAEVESALLSLPTIKEAAVVAAKDSSGGHRLVGYVVARSLPAPPVDVLRKALLEKVPPFMVPSTFSFLERLPVTSTGKVDRLNLPAVTHVRPQLSNEFVAPRTPVEAKLAEIWSGVIGVDQIGVLDDLLVLGGTSLAAMRIAFQVNAAFNVRLSLTSIFELGSIEAMAQRVEILAAVAGTNGHANGTEDREEGEL